MDLTFVIPLYNRSDLILETLRSVEQLPKENIKVIIVDDGSTDNGPEIVHKFIEEKESFSFYNRSEFNENKGASVCRNIGLSLADTQFIHFLDSDDIIAYDAYEIILKGIKDYPNRDFWVFQTQWFDFKIGDRSELQTKINGRNIIDRFLDEKNVWNNFGPVWRKTSLEKIGGFTESYTSYQDWDLMMRALINELKFSYCELDKPIGYYRQKSNGTISSTRYSKHHILSNYNMILNIYLLLFEKKMITENRRKYLANFMSRTLLYCTIDKDALKENIFYRKIRDLNSSALFSGNEVKFMKYVFKKRTSIRYNWSKQYRNRIDKFVDNHIYSYLYNKSHIE